MNLIGNRISIKESDDTTSIVILSVRDNTKNMLLLAWLFVWSVCGIIVFTQYFTTADLNIKTVIIVWLGFWAYFEYKIFKAYLWRKQGKETIKIKNDKLSYKKAIRGNEKSKEYNCESIKNMRLIAAEENSFMESIGNSYWTIAGEKIAFDYMGSEMRFGLQLNNEDAKSLLKLLKNKTLAK